MGSNPDARVEIGGRRDADSVVLYVRDNGVGIPEDKLEAVFLPFERVGDMETPGIGLGLAIVKRAVEDWGGRVWAESKPGEGSTFFFSAPAAD